MVAEGEGVCNARGRRDETEGGFVNGAGRAIIPREQNAVGTNKHAANIVKEDKRERKTYQLSLLASLSFQR